MGTEKQTDLLTGIDFSRTEEIRCRRCGKVLSNLRSIRNRHGQWCLKKIRNEDPRPKFIELLVPIIDNELLINIYYWCDAMLAYVIKQEDKELIISLYVIAKKYRNMSPIVIGGHIDKVVKLYHRIGIKRDDILNGLISIVESTGKNTEV